MTTTRSRRARRIFAVASAAAALLAISACKNAGPMDYLNPEGPVARKEHQLFVPVFWIATAIFFLVEGAIIYAAIKFRQRRGRKSPDPVQIHGNTKMEIGWTLAPAVLLAALSVPAVAMIFTLGQQEPAGAANVMRVKVIGHQWWWEYEYDTQPRITTANELVIPTGRKVFLEITSEDVIHSFWIPKLAGKQDAIPNRINTMTIEADKPGNYHGQCAEFCALSHAHMRLRAVALSPRDFDRWLAGQKAEATLPTTGLAAEGARIFREFSTKAGSCIGCHTIRGMEGAAGTLGPDLTHFASRGTFAGSVLHTNERDLASWLRDPPEIKPGSLMPDYHLSESAIDALVAFLLSLK